MSTLTALLERCGNSLATDSQNRASGNLAFFSSPLQKCFAPPLMYSGAPHTLKKPVLKHFLDKTINWFYLYRKWRRGCEAVIRVYNKLLVSRVIFLKRRLQLNTSKSVYYWKLFSTCWGACFLLAINFSYTESLLTVDGILPMISTKLHNDSYFLAVVPEPIKWSIT